MSLAKGGRCLFRSRPESAPIPCVVAHVHKVWGTVHVFNEGRDWTAAWECYADQLEAVEETVGRFSIDPPEEECLGPVCDECGKPLDPSAPVPCRGHEVTEASPAPAVVGHVGALAS